jgi:hypothetical protein
MQVGMLGENIEKCRELIDEVARRRRRRAYSGRFILRRNAL